jgi:hypothetical protein
MMRHQKPLRLVGLILVTALALGSYFCSYFLAADYVDVGDNTPMYLVRYRFGSVSLHHLAFFFEPARRIDELCFRRKHAAVMDWQTP